MFGRFTGYVVAIVVHAGILLFGGWFFMGDTDAHGKLVPVDLVGDAVPEKEKPKEEPKPEDEIKKQDEEPPPDAKELLEKLDQPAMTDNTPALEALSLNAIEAALNGKGAGGDFADALSFSSGGRIGGTGKAGGLSETMEKAFSLAEIDQKPRAVFQAAPAYPAEMRATKAEGVVSVIFIVDAGGKVTNPRVEKSSHPAFEKPALDAVKQWKFEPAVKGGQRVTCKMRVTIRFQPS